MWALELLFVLKKEPLAFALLGTGQAILALANIPTEERSSIYLIRLAAFSLILVAIYRKNRGARN